MSRSDGRRLQRALLIVDLQQDFTSPEGPFKETFVRIDHLIDNLREILPKFRAENGRVIWIKSDYSEPHPDVKYLPRPQGKRYENIPMNDSILSGTHRSFPLCIPGENGEKFVDEVYSFLIDNEKDSIVTKKYYSAFTDTNLNDLLKDMDEVHICGLTSNTCVRATSTDAFFFGYQVFLWIDCLGYRSQQRHDEALESLQKYYVTFINSKELFG